MSVPAQQILSQLQQAQGIGRPLTTQYFTYTMVFPAVASQAQATTQLLIDASSSFLVVETAAVAVDGTTTLAVASAALIQLTDSGSSTTLYNVPIPLNNAFGTAQLPFLLPMPRLFSPNATIMGQLINQITPNATTFYLSFHGFKIWS